ncbi:hypothetical protein RRG08_030749 [Elysia crispata]|uniref:Uncharacterized protein n=1 Tax=Elysia crispata TaxID=231223 RepID=A0AAE0YFB6_9GAST|nr:hypothetical protein RRG08_030749 [Elysia crispata]
MKFFSQPAIVKFPVYNLGGVRYWVKFTDDPLCHEHWNAEEKKGDEKAHCGQIGIRTFSPECTPRMESGK